MSKIQNNPLTSTVALEYYRIHKNTLSFQFWIYSNGVSK